jgi:DNA-binding SARP family transcriptional activator/TolB-like protein
MMRGKKSPRRHSASKATYLLLTLGTVSLARIATSGPLVPVLGPGKLLGLLSHLTARPNRRTRTDELVELLWGDRDSATGHHDLRQAIWQLRRRLGRAAIVVRNGEILVEASIDVDRDRFLAAVEHGRLEEAVSLYGGEFLPRSPRPASNAFEDWAEAERFKLRRLFTRAAESLTRRWMEQGRLAEAQELAQRVRDAEPRDENGWMLLLEALLAGGDTTRAAAEADALEHTFAQRARSLGAAARGLVRRARKTAGLVPASTRHQGTGEHLPLSVPFVGRAGEMATLLSAWSSTLAGSGRHIHVIAAAGHGKTRFLHEFQHRVALAGHDVLYVPASMGGKRVFLAYAAELVGHLAEFPGAPGVSPDSASVLVALNPTLSGRFAAEPRGAASTEDVVRQRALALRDLIAAVTGQAPIALLCDDLDDVDPASRDVLTWALAAIGETRLLCVTAGTSSFHDPAAAALRLPSFSDHDARSMLEGIAVLPDEAWARQLPHELVRVTDGSPRAIIDTIQAGVDRGWLGTGSTWTCMDPVGLPAFFDTLCDPPEPSILVSSFTALNGTPSYLASGLMEGLIGDLSGVDGLKVIALGSALHVNSMQDRVARAAAVGARYVVEGQVQSDDSALRVTAQLLDARTGDLLYQETVHGPPASLWTLQARLVRGVARALRRPVPNGDRHSGTRADFRAYACYLRAREHLLRFEPREIERGLQILRYGLRETGRSGLLHACLGTADVTMVYSGVDPTESRLRSAEAHAAAAVADEPHALHTHILNGWIAKCRARPQDAITAFRAVLQCDPSHPEALLQLGEMYATAGKLELSKAMMRRLFEVDPLAPINHCLAGFQLMYAGHFSEAAEGPCQLMVQLNPCPPALILYGTALARVGSIQRASEVLESVPQSGAGNGLIELATFLRHGIARDGRKTLEALTPSLKEYAAFVFYHAWHVGAMLAMLGHHDQAFEWLRRAATLGFVNYPFLLIDPLLASLRDDRRWPDFVEEFRVAWEGFET